MPDYLINLQAVHFDRGILVKPSDCTLQPDTRLVFQLVHLDRTACQTLDWTSLQLRVWLEDSLKRWALHATPRVLLFAACRLLHWCIVPSRPLFTVFIVYLYYIVPIQPCKLYLLIYIILMLLLNAWISFLKCSNNPSPQDFRSVYKKIPSTSLGYNRYLTVTEVNEVDFSTYGQSASSSWCRAPLWCHDQILIFLCLASTFLSPLCRAPSPTRGRVCSLQCNHSMIRVVQNPQPYFTASSETPTTSRARSPYLYPPGTRWLNYTLKQWVLFFLPLTTRMATVELFYPASTRESKS
jgi:hypothetical protein